MSLSSKPANSARVSAAHREPYRRRLEIARKVLERSAHDARLPTSCQRRGPNANSLCPALLCAGHSWGETLAEGVSF